MAIMLVMMWTVQQFRAQPMLGPIYQNITHFVGMAWPLWLIFPALAFTVRLKYAEFVILRFSQRTADAPA